MKKILVVGGNGYIGSRLCQYLSAQGNVVTALCYPEVPNNIEWKKDLDKVVVGDVRNEKLLAELAEEGYQVVINLVSLDHHQSNGNPAFVSSINIIPVWSLLDIFSKRGLEQFVCFSTIHVYGHLFSGEITEEYSPRPENPYALTHLIGEQICDYYNRISSVRCSVVRLSNSYGAPIFMESNCWWLVINDLCRMAYERKEIVLQSDGTPLRDFIHGWDVCRAVKCLLEDKKTAGTYHISSGKTMTIMELAEEIKRIYRIRYNIDILVLAKPSKSCVKQEIPRYHISNSKLLSIGYIQEWSIEQGIHDLFDYLEKNHETK